MELIDNEYFTGLLKQQTGVDGGNSFQKCTVSMRCYVTRPGSKEMKSTSDRAGLVRRRLDRPPVVSRTAAVRRSLGAFLRSVARGVATLGIIQGLAVSVAAPAGAEEHKTWSWRVPERPWLVRESESRYVWGAHPSYQLDRFGLPFAGPNTLKQTDALAVLMIDGGEGFDPSRETYAQSLPHRLEVRLAARLDRPVRVYYGGLPEIDSLRLLDRTRRLLSAIRPDAILVFGIGFDLYLNDPRMPFRAVDGGHAAAIDGPGLAVHPWKFLSHLIVAAPVDKEVVWSFRPKPSSRTWSKPVLEGAALTIRQGSLELITDVSRYHYQIASHAIGVVPGHLYALRYSIEVSDGKMSIGVVDLAANTWVASKSLVPGIGTDGAFGPSTDRPGQRQRRAGSVRCPRQ